jgi:hypothetical protein
MARELVVIPLPREERTPPEMKMYLGFLSGIGYSTIKLSLEATYCET